MIRYKASHAGNVISYDEMQSPRTYTLAHVTDKTLSKRERKAVARAWIAERGPKVYGFYEVLRLETGIIRRVDIKFTIEI